MAYQNMTQDEIQQLADSINNDKLKAEFRVLTNNHRASIVLGDLEHSDALVSGTQQIAKDLADYGYAPKGNPEHTLPNGNPTDSVFNEDDLELGNGENLAFTYNENNPWKMNTTQHLHSLYNQ